MAGENFISAEALEAFKQSGQYDPSGAGALTQMMNAMNAGKVDSKGMIVESFFEKESGLKSINANDPEAVDIEAKDMKPGPEAQTWAEDPNNPVNQTQVKSSTSPIKPNDYADGATATDPTSTTINPQTDSSQAVDLKGQQAVNNSKEEMEKLPKPPQTLFGMASKGLDKSGFTEGAGEFGDMAGGWGMEGLGKMGMDAGIGGNLAGAGQAAAGFGGKMLGMAGSALSPIMAGMGTAMHGIGRGMMGIQMPRY